MEKRIRFSSGEWSLEGMLDEGDGRKGVVITHPHPLYGGDMDNAVVGTIARAFAVKGYVTFRFNFRGVGQSQGDYDGGDGERSDVAAAMEFLRRRGVERIVLAGYSFGAWINARLGCLDPEGMVMVSPPVGFIDFAGVRDLACLDLVVTGNRDEIAPAERIRRAIPIWNPKAVFETIDGADHFYTGLHPELETVLGVHI